MIVSAESIGGGPREPPRDDTFRQWKQFSGHDPDLQLFKTCENGHFWTFKKIEGHGLLQKVTSSEEVVYFGRFYNIP